VRATSARLITSILYYQKLSKDFSDRLEEIAKTMVTLQNQIDSPATVALQNRRGLDVLTVERGGLYLFLEEECCFYVNQSDLVREGAK
jgi:hypothetical protein